jgi:hypothetical protein
MLSIDLAACNGAHLLTPEAYRIVARGETPGSANPMESAPRMGAGIRFVRRRRGTCDPRFAFIAWVAIA